MFLYLFKAPGGWLGILGMYGEERPVRGSVAHAWLHTAKHTKTLRFDLNLRVLGGFCGSIGVKQGGSCGRGPCLKVADLAYGTPVSVIETISTLGTESQIVGTCEKFNRGFWCVIPGSLWLKV